MLRISACLFLLAIANSAWAEERVPAYVLQMPASLSSLFIADTSKARLYRFEPSADGVQSSYESYISIGQKGVGKQEAWDRRTPLGVYFVVDQLDTSRMHEKYGLTAFPLDYPNTLDRMYERTGDGIWVHGVLPGGGQRPELDTDGCIALPNEDLAKLQSDFIPLATPVIVTREMRWLDSASIATLRTELTAAVNDWAAANAASDLHAYLSLYDDAFSYRGMSLREWAALRLQAFAGRGEISFSIDELLLLADPEEEGLFLSRFVQTTSDSANGSRNIKRLYWRRNAANEWRIIAEDNG
jgi:murein L,D-transpeptidase YafK